MAQKDFPANPNVGDTFEKGGKTYIFQGDKWVVKTDFTGPNPGKKDGQTWLNIRTNQEYRWDSKSKMWSPIDSTTTTTTPKTTSSTQSPSTSTTEPPSIPGGDSNVVKDYQAEYTSAQNNAYGYLTSISSKQRTEFLNLLYSKGFGNTKPTTGGLEDSDIDIATQFYVFYNGNRSGADNPQGVYITVNDAYNDIKKWKTTVTAKTTSFTPKTDVASIFQQVMQNTLGRAPTEKENDLFFKAYRSLESGGDAPNIQYAAEEQISTEMKAESEAASFSTFADVFEQLMRGA